MGILILSSLWIPLLVPVPCLSLRLPLQRGGGKAWKCMMVYHLLRFWPCWHWRGAGQRVGFRAADVPHIDFHGVVVGLLRGIARVLQKRVGEEERGGHLFGASVTTAITGQVQAPRGSRRQTAVLVPLW
ncbi:hypothetical protein B0H14DRAFT_2597155 [Mycena olivaceomarginata]|nr:hypothetical protein B0H14DRAFT_2597155 [Mycena olivaceomarginata]